MGTYTLFVGGLEVDPPLPKATVGVLKGLHEASWDGELDARVSALRGVGVFPVDYSGVEFAELTCSDDGRFIEPWDEEGKFYETTEMLWFVCTYLIPPGHSVNGDWYAETEGERWKIHVEDGVVTEHGSFTVYSDGDGLEQLTPELVAKHPAVA